MRKQRDICTSPQDALVSVSKQLSLYENQRGMDSEIFFDRHQKGLVGDEAISIEWANAYQHYVALHQQLESQLSGHTERRDAMIQALSPFSANMTGFVFDREDANVRR
jgi:hypothetical protein